MMPYQIRLEWRYGQRRLRVPPKVDRILDPSKRGPGMFKRGKRVGDIWSVESVSVNDEM